VGAEFGLGGEPVNAPRLGHGNLGRRLALAGGGGVVAFEEARVIGGAGGAQQGKRGQKTGARKTHSGPRKGKGRSTDEVGSPSHEKERRTCAPRIGRREASKRESATRGAP
jgi:hypothetical protein